jgi:hypothetical protein
VEKSDEWPISKSVVAKVPLAGERGAELCSLLLADERRWRLVCLYTTRCVCAIYLYIPSAEYDRPKNGKALSVRQREREHEQVEHEQVEHEQVEHEHDEHERAAPSCLGLSLAALGSCGMWLSLSSWCRLGQAFPPPAEGGKPII